MKGFLLSAGRATRLRPLTDRIPKCMIPIRGIPLLAIWVEKCARAGLTEILINLHWKPGPVLDFLRGYRSPLRIKVTHEPELLGSAGTIMENWDWVRNEKGFCVVYSDVLTTFDLCELIEFDQKHEGILTMALHRVSDPAGCGLAEVDAEGRIVRFEEKPAYPRSRLAFAGMCVGHRDLIDHLPKRKPLDLGHDVFPALSGKMWGYIIKDYLTDTGTPERLAEAERTWPGLEGGVARVCR